MLKFNFDVFASILQNAPDRSKIFEPEEHSEYLQKIVFDPLIENAAIDIKTVDFSKFELRNVTPNNYANEFRHITGCWARGFNCFVKTAPALATRTHGFF